MRKKAKYITTHRLTKEEFSRLHVLQRVSLESVWGWLEQCPVLELKKGEVLLEKGKANQKMYMVLNGSLNVHLEKEKSEPVAVLDAGQTVGEISVIDDSPATAFVISAQTTRLMAIEEDIFWRLVEVSHEFASNMLLLLARRMRANNFRIEKDVKVRQNLEHEATVDALTGMRNRRWLENNLNRLVERHRRGNLELAVLMFDIDNFKKFNDNYGHAAGDRVLTATAQVVMEKLRPTDLAARYGGEEFVVILPGTGYEGSKAVAKRLCVAVASHKVKSSDDGGFLPPVTISIGVASLTDKDTSVDLLARSDAALYRAKENGRNRVEG